MSRVALRFNRLTWWLLGLFAALLVTWSVFHAAINHALGVHFLLASRCPREDVLTELVNRSSDPAKLLRQCWNTGRIVHRQLVAEFLGDQAASPAAWLTSLDDLLLAGAVDADMSVRELALATLDARRSPRLLECARAQVGDLDPMVRSLGLEYLRKTDPHLAVPIVIPLLDDPDPQVACEAEIAMMRWSGVDFGVRMKYAIPSQDGPNPGGIIPQNAEIIRRGLDLRKEWWRTHAKEYALPSAQTTDRDPAKFKPNLAPDFTLKDLQGTKVSLSDFRGKTVLLNFWATWCTACEAEIPDLISLRAKLGDRLVVLGVALDGVPDEHGHDARDNDGQARPRPGRSLSVLRSKIERTVKARGINYPVLWDPVGAVGGEFNGGELPTTVLIDAAGRVRRRFIGQRNLQVFEAMVAEAGADAPLARGAQR